KSYYREKLWTPKYNHYLPHMCQCPPATTLECTRFPVTRRSQALSRFGQFRLFAEGQSPAKAGRAALHLSARCCTLSRTYGDQHEIHFDVRSLRFGTSLFWRAGAT